MNNNQMQQYQDMKFEYSSESDDDGPPQTSSHSQSQIQTHSHSQRSQHSQQSLHSQHSHPTHHSHYSPSPQESQRSQHSQHSHPQQSQSISHHSQQSQSTQQHSQHQHRSQSHSHPSQHSQHSHSHSHSPQHQQQPPNNDVPDYSSSDNDEKQNDNNKARSSVYHPSQNASSSSTNTWNIFQRQHLQQRFQSPTDNDNLNDDDQFSVVPVSTVAPARNPYNIAQRPDIPDPYPPSHAQSICLVVNAIQTTPVIHGKLHRYNVRFHPRSDDPNDAQIPENNRQRRENIIKELAHDIRNMYGKFDFDNTVMYCDNEVIQTHTFQYIIRENDEYDDDSKHNEKNLGTIRIQYNSLLDFNSMEVIKELSHEYISQLAHILHRNIMRKIGYVQFGRSHYIDPSKIHSLNIWEYPHLEAMHGFLSTLEYTQEFQSVIFFRHKLRLKEKRTIHVIMNGHYDTAYSHQYEAEEQKEKMYQRDVRKELKGRYFITLYARKCICRIHDIDFERTLDHTFSCKGDMISYRDYFYNVYKEELRQQYPGLIMVKNRSKRIDYYPPELCYLTGYPDSLRKNKKITGIIARNSAIPIRERMVGFEKIIKDCNRYNQYESRQRMISEPNVQGHTRTLTYGNQLLQIKAHRIVPANIMYNSIQSGGLTLIPNDQLLRQIRDIRPFGNAGGGTDAQPHVVPWGLAYFTHRPQQPNNRPQQPNNRPQQPNNRPQQPNNRPQQPNDREQTDKHCCETLRKFFYRTTLQWFTEEHDVYVALGLYPTEIEIRSPRPDDLELYLNNIIGHLKEAIVSHKLEGIVFILPSMVHDDYMRTEIYNTVKALCNVETGTITQCIKASTICPPDNRPQRGGRRGRNKAEQSLLSTYRQFMVKLGVIPWKVLFDNINEADNNGMNNPKVKYLVDGVLDFSVPTMVIGIDVNHNRSKGVSTIGFIATMDKDFVRIMGQVDHQSMGQEVVGIQQLQLLTENALRCFHQINTVSPHQIFVYRDGVSLGELNKVVSKELTAIKRAALNVAAFPQPKVQFMVVQKRVNARFYEWDNRLQQFVGPRPPIIVDTGIVSTKFWDFYLVACAAPRDKVPNPVRVIIVNDDLQLKARNSKNDIELFTYALCNLYYGWGGPVKIPHVIKYADKIAEQYSQIYDKMYLINKQQNKPNAATGLNLSHHFL